MKIAVLLTGFLRTNKNTFQYLENNLLQKYNCDLFCISWDMQENNTKLKLDDFYLYNKYLKNYKIESSEEYYKNKKVFVPIDRENDVFKNNARAKEHGSYWANRLIDQWKLVYEGHKLIKNLEQYDIIVRMRYDLKIENIKFLRTDSLVIPQDIGGWNFTDHMAYGNPQVMQTYSNLYNSIESLYINDNIDVTHAVDMPKYYILKNNIKYIIDNNIKYGLDK